MDEDLPLGKLVSPVTVGLVERPDLVWVSSDGSRERLMKELDGLKLDNFSSFVKIGTRAATRFAEDGRIYRCEILGEGEDGILIRYIDYGNVEYKTIEELFNLPPGLVVKPAIAVKVIIEGVHGIANSSKNRARVEKKLLVDGLGVVVDLDAATGNLIGSFFIDGKPLKVTKRNNTIPLSTSTPIDPRSQSDILEEFSGVCTQSSDIGTLYSEPKYVEEKSGTLTCFSHLPALELPDDVRTPGCVVYVSPEGGVWFSPEWVEPTMDMISGTINVIDSEDGGLINVHSHQVVEGLVCLARFSQDGALYRARVNSVSNTSHDSVIVQFFDFGDVEKVCLAKLFLCPANLAKLTPAAVEVMVAQPFGDIKETRKEILEKNLIEVERVFVVVNTNLETGERTARFFDEHEEIMFDGGNDKYEERDKCVDDQRVFAGIAKINNAEQNTVVEDNGCTYVKVIDAAPLPTGKETPVFLSYVETISKVWVISEADEDKSLNMMDRLTKTVGDCKPPVKNVEVGHVYGTIFSEDNEMYRCAVTARGWNENCVSVRFIDHGNSETKKIKELFNIPVAIARESAVALLVEITDNKGQKDSQTNRDTLELALTGEDVAVNSDRKFVVNGTVVKFHFDEGVLIKEPCSQLIERRDVEELPVKFPVSPGLESPTENNSLTMLQEDHINGVGTNNLESEASSQTAGLKEKDVIQTYASRESIEVAITPNVVSTDVYICTEDNTSDSQITSNEVELNNNKPNISTSKQPFHMNKAIVGRVSEPTRLSKQPEGGARGCDKLKTTKISVNQHLVDDKHSEITADKKQEKTKYVPPGRINDQCIVGASQHEKMAIDVKISSSCLRPGSKVVAQWPGNKGWHQAVVGKIDMVANKVWVENESNGAGDGPGPAWVDVSNVKSADLPVAALNMIDNELTDEVIRVSGDGASASREQGKNFVNSSRLSPREIVSLAKTEKVSQDLQSLVISGSHEDVRRVLESLLSSPQTGLNLMIHSKANHLVRKIISVLPSIELNILQQLIQSNFFFLSTHVVGCHVVQAMLQQSDMEKVSQLANNIVMCTNFIDLVSDKYGTFVAQGCLSKLSSSQLPPLVSSLMEHVIQLGCCQHATFFLQQLINILSDQKDCEVARVLLTEEVMAGLSSLVMNEAGTRLVQVVLSKGDLSVLVRVHRWVHTNLETVVQNRPAVFTALLVVKLLVSQFEGLGYLLDMLVQGLLLPVKGVGQSRLLVASLHPVGHLLVRDLVGRTNCLNEEVKNQMLNLLGQSVEILRNNKFGSQVLMGLGTVLL